MPPIEGRSYSNVTLTSLNGDLSVVVFLPKGVNTNNDDEIFYYSSRFDHGSMIGDIIRKRRFAVQDPQCQGQPDCPAKVVEREHILFGTDAWRQPHNSHWPESGLGLASEFGVGDDGSFCFYRCGWYQENDVTNGVLGYQEASIGEPFLKIGVGELLKGTCPTCDSTEDYKFNSPYLLASQPQWNLTILNRKVSTTVDGTSESVSSIRLDHEARLRTQPYGYALSKQISLNDRVLEVTTTLTNKGANPFSTAWYSHNFFTCDHTAVGPGYSVNLNLQGSGHIIDGGMTSTTQGSVSPVPQLFEEPGTWSWASPLLDYARVTPYPNSVQIDMERALDPGVRIQAEFTRDPNTDGGYTFNACQTWIQSSLRIPSDDPNRNIHNDPIIRMYAYNLYIERGTFSPEPQILIRSLQPNQSVSWTQHLVIQDIVTDNEIIVTPNNFYPTMPKLGFLGMLVAFPSYLILPKILSSCMMIVVCLSTYVLATKSAAAFRRYDRQRRGYRSIEDPEQ